MKSTLKHKVEYTLKHHEQARNNDNSLVAYFLYDWYPQYFNGGFFDMSKLKELPNVYDIIRYRKKIQNEEGKYLPTDPQIYQKRFEKQIRIRREFGYNPEFAEPIQI